MPLDADARAGKLAPEDRAPPVTSELYEGIPTPRYDLLRKSGYQLSYTVPFTRGRIRACDFCTVPAVWSRVQKRPIGDIIRDIKAGRRSCSRSMTSVPSTTPSGPRSG